MAQLDLRRKFSMSRAELGAHNAFLLNDPSAHYIVESGHVDLFAAIVDENGEVQARDPYINRIEKDKILFGAPAFPNARGNGVSAFTFQAVPSRNSVVLQGKREVLISPDKFDLTVVSLIDDWVMNTSEFIARHRPPTPRNAFLLEADPEVLYGAQTAISAHHLEILWVRSDRPMYFMGRREMEIPPGKVLPLSEYIWFTTAEDAHISAVHTPSVVLAGDIWTALDNYSVRVLQSASQIWLEDRQSEEAQHVGDDRYRTEIRGKIVQNLSKVLGASRQTIEAVPGYSNTVQKAAAILAESAKFQLVEAPAPSDDLDLYDAVSQLVAASGIRTRRLNLSEGWERRDGPSFIGVAADDDTHAIAVVNRGRGAFEMFDPALGKAERVNRKRAKRLGRRGVQLYFPLDPDTEGGLSAVRQSLRGKRRDILGVATMGGLAAAIALLTPILTGQLLAEIIPRVDVSMWVAALGALIVGAFATAAVSIVGALSLLRIEARIDENLQSAIWNRLLSLPLPFFRRFLAGDLSDRANGVSLIRQLLTGAASASLLSGIFSIFSFFLLFYYSVELALWTGAIVVALAGVSWAFTKRQIRHQRAAMAAQGEIDGLVFQLIIGLAKIRQANAELHALKHWSEKYAKQRRESLSARKWMAGQLTFNALFLPASQLVISALIWYSLVEGTTGDGFALADFLSFNAAFGQFVAGATGLTATLTTIVTALPLFERVLPIIEAKPENVGGTVLEDLSGRVECEDVSFRYPSTSSDILQNISFEIRPGEYVAFLGPSGAGKSTLYRLLLGFERPTSGSVLVDGHDLLSLDLRSMRRHFGVVLQNGQIIPNNIYKIIAGELPLSEQEALEAARAVGLDEDIETLPMGLSTVIQEGGSGLSGGQKQRLLVARALARKPRVLLLDEATSMLDNRTQDIIRVTLRGLSVTRIVIAHRLSTVIDTDRIYVMQDGKIVEVGHFEELKERGGVLAEMISRQLV